jgi:hypothetical protein
VARWAIHFALTQAVELPIYAAGCPAWPIWRRIAVGFGASALTHPWLWFVLPPLLLGHIRYGVYLALVEPMIALVEAFYLAGMGLPLRRAFLLSMLANAASLTAGLLLHVRWAS